MRKIAGMVVEFGRMLGTAGQSGYFNERNINFLDGARESIPLFRHQMRSIAPVPERLSEANRHLVNMILDLESMVAICDHRKRDFLSKNEESEFASAFSSLAENYKRFDMSNP